MDNPRTAVLADIVAATAGLEDLDPSQRDVWVSGAVALFADADGRSDGSTSALFESMVSLRHELREVGNVVGPAAMDELTVDQASARAVGVTALSDRSGSRSIVVELSRDGSATSDHAMLIELHDDGTLQTIAFSGPDPVAALEDDDRLVVAPQPVDGLTNIVAEALAAPVVWDEALRLNQLVAVLRLRSVLRDPAFTLDLVVPDVAPYEPRPADADDDRYAVELLRSTCAQQLEAEPPVVWGEVVASFGAHRVDASDVLHAAGAPAPSSAFELARLTAAYVRPLALDHFEPADREAIDALEWADWLGAVVQLVRAGVGTEVDPMGLVDNINASPEVTTTIPKRDRDYIAYAFGLTLHAWEVCGALDENGRLTELGRWLLPVGLAVVAGADLDVPPADAATSESS